MSPTPDGRMTVGEQGFALRQQQEQRERWAREQRERERWATEQRERERWATEQRERERWATESQELQQRQAAERKRLIDHLLLHRR